MWSSACDWPWLIWMGHIFHSPLCCIWMGRVAWFTRSQPLQWLGRVVFYPFGQVRDIDLDHISFELRSFHTMTRIFWIWSNRNICATFSSCLLIISSSTWVILKATWISTVVLELFCGELYSFVVWIVEVVVLLLLFFVLLNQMWRKQQSVWTIRDMHLILDLSNAFTTH